MSKVRYLQLNKKYNYIRPIKINNNELIRLGRKKDGGYVIAKSLLKSEILISFGVGNDWSFEKDFIKRNKNLKVFMYDYTISTIHVIYVFIKRFLFKILLFKKKFDHELKVLKKEIKNVKEYNKFINQYNIKFFKKKIANKNFFHLTKVENILSILKNKKIFLKCDIEGYEYDIINELLNYQNSFSGLCIEFHKIKENYSIFKKNINKLNKKFYIIHTHANNNSKFIKDTLPDTIEFVFLKKTEVEDKIRKKFINQLPNKKLDRPCNLSLREIGFKFLD